jgi:hypothetical protein
MPCPSSGRVNIEYGYRVVGLSVSNASGTTLTWWDSTPDPTMWCGDVVCGDYLVGISDGRPRLRRNPRQWRGVLAACFIFRSDEHLLDLTRNQLQGTSGISSCIYSHSIVLVHCLGRSQVLLSRFEFPNESSIALPCKIPD